MSIYFIGDIMNEIDPKKYQKIINKNKSKNYFKNLIIRILLVALIFLSLAIIYKSNSNLKNKIDTYIFKEEISFVKIKNIYNKYLGGILPIKKESNTVSVFNEKLEYTSVSKYNDGAKLTVNEAYLVPAIKEGMVVFAGEKEEYGKTIIVEDLEGIRIWYGNINNTSLKLYDYIEKGSLIGEVNNDLYLVISKDNQYLNYEEYIK